VRRGEAHRVWSGHERHLSQRPPSHTPGTAGQHDLKLCGARIYAVPAMRDSGWRTVPLGKPARPGSKPLFGRANRPLALFGQSRRLALFGQNGRTAHAALAGQAPACRPAACLSARSCHRHSLLRCRSAFSRPDLEPFVCRPMRGGGAPSGAWIGRAGEARRPPCDRRARLSALHLAI
jgi:hypothetical protein